MVLNEIYMYKMYMVRKRYFKRDDKKGWRDE